MVLREELLRKFISVNNLKSAKDIQSMITKIRILAKDAIGIVQKSNFKSWRV